jgi:hypothetical protein
MDLGFLATANSITGTYFDHTAAGRSSVSEVNAEAASQFSKSLENTGNTVQAEKTTENDISQNQPAKVNPLSEHAARLGFSIDNRVYDMLDIQISESMNSMINSAMNNAMDNLAKAI